MSSSGAVLRCVSGGRFNQWRGSKQNQSEHGHPLSTRGQRGYVCQSAARNHQLKDFSTVDKQFFNTTVALFDFYLQTLMNWKCICLMLSLFLNSFIFYYVRIIQQENTISWTDRCTNTRFVCQASGHGWTCVYWRTEQRTTQDRTRPATRSATRPSSPLHPPCQSLPEGRGWAEQSHAGTNPDCSSDVYICLYMFTYVNIFLSGTCIKQ